MALPKNVRIEAEKALNKDQEGETAEERLPQNEPAATPPAGEQPAAWNPAPAEKPPVRVSVPPVTKPAAEPAPAVPAPDGAVLAKISQQLTGLEKDLAELMEDFDAYAARTFNYGPITTKIDALQGDLEKLLTPQPEQDRAEAAPDSAERMEELLRKLLEKQEQNDRQLIQCLRDNKTHQTQVRQQMQGELDELRKQQSGAHFNPILKEIASMYADYQMIFDDETLSRKTRNNLTALFEQMAELLEDYGAEIRVSKEGSERPKQGCKIITKVYTGDKSMHNTIAKSRQPGVLRDRLILAQEYVDVYVYDPELDVPVTEDAPTDETPDLPIPTDDTPPVNVDPAPAEEAPVQDTPVEEAPAGETPVEEAPAEEAPVEEAPAEDTPVEEAPIEETPVEEAPAEDAPVEEVPVEETPAEPERKSSFFDKFKRK